MRKFFLSLLFLPLTALAVTQQFDWTTPTARVDGSALSASQVAGYEIACVGWKPTGGVRGACTQFPTFFSAGAGGVAVVITGTIPASGGTAYWTVRTKDTDGLFSNPTPEVSKVFPNTSPPNPPSNVTVAAITGSTFTPAYKYSVSSVGVATRSTTLAGLVPLGSPCQPVTLFTYRAKPYKQVLQSAVLWESNGVAPSVLVAAACS